jgi:Zn-dependent protease with chaperone function
MQVVGFQTHAAENRKRAAWYVLSYVAVFQLLAGSIFAVVLMVWDFDAIIHFNPFTYFAGWGLFFALVSLVLFILSLRQQERVLRRRLNVIHSAGGLETRFARIAEQQAILQGIKNYKLGVIESEARNALTLGEFLSHPQIVVTRGLLNSLNDDELAAVIAHEFAHLRGNDTLLLSVNAALMRTAVVMQIENLLRPESWHYLVIAVLFPSLLPMYLIGGLTTMLAMKIAWRAQAGISGGRDHIADGEAIRFTHFPEALIGAIRKCGGHGYFPHAEAAEPFLFEGKPQAMGGTHADNGERVAFIERYAHEMMMDGRSMRDTRRPGVAPAQFGRKGAPVVPAVAQGWQNWDRPGKPKRPAPYDWEKIMLRFTDVEAFDKWDAQRVAYFGWKPEDKRNIFGMKPNVVFPSIVGAAFIAVLNFPTSAPPGEFVSTYLGGRVMRGMGDETSLKCAMHAGKEGECSSDGTFRSVSKPVAASRTDRA